MTLLRSAIMCAFVLATIVLPAMAASISLTTQPSLVIEPPIKVLPYNPLVLLEDGGFRRGAGIVAFTDDGRMDMCVAAQCLIQNAAIVTGFNGYTPANALKNRKVTRQLGKYTFEGWLPSDTVKVGFFMEVIPDGDLMQIKVRREGQWQAGWGFCAFQIHLPLDIYAGTENFADGKLFVLPTTSRPGGPLISGAREVTFVPNNAQANLELTSPTGINIYDARQWDVAAYQVGVDFPPGDVSDISLTVFIPQGNRNPLPPRLCISRVGYSSNGMKEVAMEWIKGLPRPVDTVKVVDSAGTTVASGRFGPTLTLKHLQNEYATFDFSTVRTPGKYTVVWDAGPSREIEIKSTIFPDSLWAPTLDQFIPWQMCHANITYANGSLPTLPACHMDDGQRVPANFAQVDGFKSYECNLTPFKEGDMIPCGIGGWHDAGDYDLNVHAQAHTTWKLALTYEEFRVDRDNMTVRLTNPTSVICGQPDGVPDILQQVAWGARWLLKMQQQDGLVYPGVCCRPEQYTANELPETCSDGMPGTHDERHVYVDYQPDAQLAQVISLAAAGRVLSRTHPTLSQQCITAAEQAYTYYRAAPPICRPNIYFDKTNEDGRVGAEAAALVELYLTTHKTNYLGILENMAPGIAHQSVTWPAASGTGIGGWWYAPAVLARLAPQLSSGTLKDAIIELCHRAEGQQIYESSPRPFPFQWYHLWDGGPCGPALNRTFDAYYLQKVTSGTFNVAGTQRDVLWMLGYHPLSDVVFVCDVAQPSPKYLYNGRLHGRYGMAPASVPGAVVPSMGGVPGGGMVLYNDVHGNYFHNEACIFTAADYLFAVHALKAAGF